MEPVKTLLKTPHSSSKRMSAEMELTSSLTSLDTISTPGSYYTAKDSPLDGANTTAISSPVDYPARARFRNAREIPHELKMNCQIHMEENMHAQAIQLFDAFLSDGVTLLPTRTAKAARIAPPAQIALLNTLMIHPVFTSRTADRSDLHVAAQSLAYLRGLLSLVGPVNANLRAAFMFSGSERGFGCFNSGRSSSQGSDTSDSDAIVSKYATDQSLWRRSPDFWATLGWAFQCAASHPHRWRCWKVWLEYMVEVLEVDWDERKLLDEEEHDRCGGRRHGSSSPPVAQDEECKYPRLRKSLLAAYVDGLQKERKQPLREVVRALMAFTDGENSSDKVFYKEVFAGETVVGSRKSKRKRALTAVDLEKDQFGDYLDELGSEDEDEGGNNRRRANSPTPTRPKRGRPRRQVKEGSPTPPPAPTPRFSEGVTETIPLRLRIFRLLSAAAAYIPDRFARVDDLYEKVAERVRGLPLPMFRLFVESHATTLPDFAHVSLLRNIADGLLPKSGMGGGVRPDPDYIDPVTDEQNGISVIMLLECFLPYASNRVTAEDNAKLSLVLESMLWYIYANRDIGYTHNLRKMVERGIKARQDKIASRKKNGGSKVIYSSADVGGEKAAREALDRSARNLRVLVDVFEATSV
ncbi:hypothetical protein B0H66DRAFT_553925 [Apodospora peruviana]|uniref:Uncharacterized protein n=1 Tax=Apodospora peruviana TaxID=516989 RepID=A0AAE0M808_9PEZI|nr:hypothetical protein B0H66DRAFT_553925 [Apodospora peruviana]